MPSVSQPLLLFAALSPLLLIAAHVAAYRFFRIYGRVPSGQLFLIRMTFFGNVPVLLFGIQVGLREGRPGSEIFWGVLFLFIVFNGLSYAYFHLFNMSETARRLRMMMALRGGPKSPDALREDYSPRDMVLTRLGRLRAMGQVETGPDGRIRIRNKFFLRIAQIIYLWRVAFGFDKIESL